MEKISWTEAINQMRKLTDQNQPFSFTHSTYDSAKNESNGIVKVNNALLRKSLRNDTFKNVDPDLLLPYVDKDNNNNRQCYKCLITEFNGLEVTLN